MAILRETPFILTDPYSDKYRLIEPYTSEFANELIRIATLLQSTPINKLLTSDYQSLMYLITSAFWNSTAYKLLSSKFSVSTTGDFQMLPFWLDYDYKKFYIRSYIVELNKRYLEIKENNDNSIKLLHTQVRLSAQRLTIRLGLKYIYSLDQSLFHINKAEVPSIYNLRNSKNKALTFLNSVIYVPEFF